MPEALHLFLPQSLSKAVRFGFDQFQTPFQVILKGGGWLWGVLVGGDNNNSGGVSNSSVGHALYHLLFTLFPYRLSLEDLVFAHPEKVELHDQDAGASHLPCFV